MTYLKRSLLIFFTSIGMIGMVACDDYDSQTFNYVEKTTVSLQESSLHSLTFRWTEVDNVTTYKYVFVEGGVETSRDNPLAEGTTTSTSMVFENLTPGSNYTLWVTPVSDKGLVSRSFYGSYSTVAITPLDSPTVSCELDSTTYDLNISWTEIEDAADYTWYYIIDNDTISASTPECEASLNVKLFDAGVYDFYVIANSAVEEHSSSLPGSCRVTLGSVPIAELFAGKYTVYNEGMTCYNLSAWTDFTETHTTTISRVTDTSIKIGNLYKSIGLTGFIDESTQTILFASSKSSKYSWYLYGFDDSFDYQSDAGSIGAYYEIEDDGSYTIYFYDENTSYGYVWAYGYPYTDGYFPYWVGMSVLWRTTE